MQELLFGFVEFFAVSLVPSLSRHFMYFSSFTSSIRLNIHNRTCRVTLATIPYYFFCMQILVCCCIHRTANSI